MSRTAAKTHLGRQAAAQKGKEAGVSESDIKKHGIWNQGVARGAYEAAIPNRDAIVALSSRPLSTTSPTTPRYKVPVPLALQATMCPWLEAEEKAYHERLAADKYCIDEALVNFFGLMRWARCAYFSVVGGAFRNGPCPRRFLHPTAPTPCSPPFREAWGLDGEDAEWRCAVGCQRRRADDPPAGASGRGSGRGERGGGDGGPPPPRALHG